MWTVCSPEIYALLECNLVSIPLAVRLPDSSLEELPVSECTLSHISELDVLGLCLPWTHLKLWALMELVPKFKTLCTGTLQTPPSPVLAKPLTALSATRLANSPSLIR